MVGIKGKIYLLSKISEETGFNPYRIFWIKEVKEVTDKTLYFALDVGTRTVIGVVLESRNDRFHILASEIEEHNTRSMLDGQIHDIPAVTKVIKKVKNKLEKRIKGKLTEVSVAAAGRALYTQKASVNKKLTQGDLVDDNTVYSLVMTGIQEAQKLIKKKYHPQEDNNYYCVGHSVIGYYLDSQKMINLIGQRGSLIGVEVIATFLPRIVVDSLNSVITGAGLVIKNMTLEPIAASSLVITEGMRKLNLALVDIGAGTSDIAISYDGAICSYAMVPSAGDMITEAISDKLLVDFNTAEVIKRKLNSSTSISYEDILGMTIHTDAKVIIDKISLEIENLAKKISQEIITLNGKGPQAILLIGGGSLTPLLAEKIAIHAGLTKDRVAIRGREVINNITGAANKLSGPMAITPIGIAFTQTLGIRNSFEFIIVNGEMVRIFGREKLIVLDALIASGFKNSELVAKPGMGITVELNNKIKILKGLKGTDPQIKINGEPANLDDFVKYGDKITFIPAQPGEDAKGHIKDILPKVLDKSLFINGQKRYLKPMIYQNRNRVKHNTPLKDKAIITVNPINTVKDVCEYLEIDTDTIKEVSINLLISSLETEVHNNDEIEFIYKSKVDNQNHSTDIVPNHTVNITLNDENILLEDNNNPLMLLDIFKKINFPTTPPLDKKKLVLKVNNEDAAYTSYINDGDKVEIYWA